MNAMRVVVTPLPVLYACQGCAEFGQGARELGERLDRAGLAQLVWLGAAVKPLLGERYPVHALDGCAQGCARRWLEGRGIPVERHQVLVAR
jgi:uncharacterized metal-binding protein